MYSKRFDFKKFLSLVSLISKSPRKQAKTNSPSESYITDLSVWLEVMFKNPTNASIVLTLGVWISSIGSFVNLVSIDLSKAAFYSLAA